MDILFIHGNYPAQFRTLAELFGKQSVHRVCYLTARKDPEEYPLKGVIPVRFKDIESSKNQHNLGPLHDIIARGLLIQQEVTKLLQKGFKPKLVFFHGGNGLGMYLRQILPEAKLVGYFEWYFSKRCAKLILGKDDLATLNYITSRNIPTESEILSCDAAVVPTDWQRSQFPSKLQHHLTTIFDGVDTQYFRPPDPSFSENSIDIQGEDCMVTIKPDNLLLSYATRGMEPLRGFPEFMRALPPLLKQLPQLKVIIGGRDRCAYGPCAPSHGGSWKQLMLDELGDFKGKDRVFFTGLMNYDNYRNLLWRTNLHCYLTLPYVTSWSFFEAMACGAPMLFNKSKATHITEDDHATLQLEKLTDISQEKVVLKITEILQKQNQHRESHLPEKYNLKACIQEWETCINDTLKISSQANNSSEKQSA